MQLGEFLAHGPNDMSVEQFGRAVTESKKTAGSNSGAGVRTSRKRSLETATAVVAAGSEAKNETTGSGEPSAKRPRLDSSSLTGAAAGVASSAAPDPIMTDAEPPSPSNGVFS